ncbi:hypothetical protein F2Q69_00047986 [Brassica cretica]|uniref:Uncharacterized protein n=1 Tax=Brassica cretica TaxID=69181 RepID=A0A8S9PW66_BRACR|nr:hypothetical protein F2Q69_00047986 [Brassica cretica]
MCQMSSYVNQHPVADVIPVLLKSGQSASREEAVEKRNSPPGTPLYIHISTRSNKGIWLLLVEPLDLERVIYKSKRAVDTLQAAIDSVEIQASIDTIHPASIDTVHPMSTDTVQPTSIDTKPVSENTVRPGTVHRGEKQHHLWGDREDRSAHT